MRHLVISGLGATVNPTAMTAENRSRRFALPRAVYGVAIGTDSEIDQCAIGIGSEGAPGLFPGHYTNPATFSAAVLADEVVRANTGGFAKIGVGAPWLGRVASSSLVVAATRGCRQPLASSPTPVLTLDLAESEQEAIMLAGRTRRAPLDIDFSGAMGNGGDRTLIFPTYGRSWWSLAIFMEPAGATSTSWTLDGVTESIYQIGATSADGFTVRSNPLQLDTETDTTTIDSQIEADSSFDRMHLGLLAAGNLTYYGRFRAED